jgi:hypothetical protein
MVRGASRTASDDSDTHGTERNPRIKHERGHRESDAPVVDGVVRERALCRAENLVDEVDRVNATVHQVRDANVPRQA